ncbi:MAG: hypothetical protein HQM10_10045 [Candidatus Riflebacteria bacterium]|nr:hypothetical protein [Candidatus Riflebacteria bacterium]
MRYSFFYLKSVIFLSLVLLISEPLCCLASEFPVRKRAGIVIVRNGIDAFIRNPSEAHFPYRVFEKDGQNIMGPIGSWSKPDSLRYLLRFDVEGAFEKQGLKLEEFNLTRAVLLLTPSRKSASKQMIPITIHPLTNYFAGRNTSTSPSGQCEGADWTNRVQFISWYHEGGDFLLNPSAKAIIPAVENREVEIDITSIMKLCFDNFRKTGKWVDYGMIIMRDKDIQSDCLYRNIYGFNAVNLRMHHEFRGKTLVPELYLE